MDIIQHRTVIKFCVTVFKPTEIFNEIKDMLGDAAPSFTTVKNEPLNLHTAVEIRKMTRIVGI